jgi:hypothetical protein
MALKGFYLNNNILTGTISELGSLAGLKELDISNCLFTGSMPDDLGWLAIKYELGFVNVSHSLNLIGEGPAELCSLNNDTWLSRTTVCFMLF